MARTSRDRTVFPITVRELEVLEAGDVGPGMRRIVLGGAGLEAHRRGDVDVPALRSLGFDDDVKLILPDPVTGERAVPEALPDGRLAWDERSIGLSRTYTIRRFEPEEGRLVVDVAQHIAGLASTWAARVEPGERVHLAGPKASASLPEHTDRLVLAGDETALPAIARCLEELPAGHPVQVVVEVAERAHVVPLSTRADARVEWVVRAEGGDLVAAVDALDFPGEGTYVWVAGEALRIKPLRRRLASDRGVAREHTEVTGYWRRRDVVTLGTDPATLDLGASAPRAAARIHETTELAPAFAVRAACALDLFVRIDDGARDVATLAAACGVAPALLRRLLRYLASLGYVRLVPAGAPGDEGREEVGLAELGEELADPDSHVAGSLGGAAARRELAFVGLLDGLLTGDAVRDAEGRTVAEAIAADPGLEQDDADAVAREASFTAPALPEVAGIGPGTRVVFVGPGAGVYADEAVRQVPGARVAVAGTPGELRRARDEVAAARRGAVDFVGSVPAGTDLAVGVDLPATTPAAALTERLRPLASAGRVVLVTALLDPARPDEHELEDDLRHLCVHGGGLPDRAGLDALAAAAGLRVVTARPVGWGRQAVTLAAASGAPASEAPAPAAATGPPGGAGTSRAAARSRR